MAGWCVLLGKLFPKILSNGILLWSYVQLVIVSNQLLYFAALFVDTIGLVLLSLSIYTYFKIIQEGAGSPLDYPELLLPLEISDNPVDGHEGLPARSHPAANMSPPMEILELKTVSHGRYRYCNKCNVWKPDRAHHCLLEERCVLRMDHYCPWFGCTIGFFNHKFFIQELFYVWVYASFLFWVSFYLVFQFFAEERYDHEFLSIGLLALLIVSMAFSFCLTFFFLFSAWLVAKNTTTIEFQDDRTGHSSGEFRYQFDARGKKVKIGNIYDVGMVRNWCQVMGERWWHWLLPVSVAVKLTRARHKNGLSFEVNPDTYAKWQSNAEIQNQLNRQLEDYRTRRQGS